MTKQSKGAASIAERARRYRERQRGDKGVLAIEVDLFELIEAMLAAGLLTPADSRDRRAISTAASLILERWKYSVTRDASNGSTQRRLPSIARKEP